MLASLGRQTLARELQRASQSAVASCSRTTVPLPTSSPAQRSARAICLPSSQRRRQERLFATTSAVFAEPTAPTDSTGERSQVQSSMDDVDPDNAPSELGTETPDDLQADLDAQAEADAQAQRDLKVGGIAVLPPYRQWVKDQGKKAFEKPPPGRGPFWIGETPFPLNPSFQPPAPLSQGIKKAMRDLHWSDPHKHSVHALSSKFHVPIERVVAVLRLMALESEHTKQGIPLQTVFQKEMERLLGAATRAPEIQKEPTEMSEIKGIRGAAPREEVGMTEAALKQPSPITDAIEAEQKERKSRYRTLPTGSPSTYGPPPQQTTKAHRSMRTPMTYVDLSPRPKSYRGAGVIARNEARAARRQRNTDKRGSLASMKRDQRAQDKMIDRYNAMVLEMQAKKAKNPYMI